MTRRNKKAFSKISPLFFIFITVLINRFGLTILIPVMPFLVDQFRSDALTLGLLTASFSIAQFIATPATGVISDRFGRRPVMLICVLGTALSLLMFGWAGALWVLFLSRILDGLTGGTDSTALAYIADTSAPEDRGKNFGLTGAAFGLGFILGPALGGILANVYLTLPVFFAAGLAFFNLALGYFTLPESLKKENRESFELGDLNPFYQILKLVKNHRIQGLVWGNFIFNLAFIGFTSTFVLFLFRKFNWTPLESGVIFVFLGVTSTFIQGFLIRKILPRWGEATVTVSGLICVSLSMLMIALIQPNSSLVYPLLYTSMAFLSIGMGFFTPAIRGLISNQVSDKEQGKTIGGNQGLKSLATILGPILAGLSFDYIGTWAPFGIGSALILVALGCIMLNLRTLETVHS
ncbi:MFS transporter [Leptothoe spongobia]|uniref:MFS transporter n=1 Tax=Leptothoe spongobia TAU-MAC 1115 TaxID=1967444 RepID=A0A947GKF5_9CYAN|nr:MFS transporter [Leptothoe spongobia]MBT9314066.1 MFS transporter [Leptothoe spongobia TAU-MAC 1115]